MELPKDIQKYLERIALSDFRCDLEPMREASRLIGVPWQSYTTIHIAGTNGKGSTAAFLSAILSGAGLKTGLMTSPHLINPHERIQINRENISAANFTRLVKKIRAILPNEEFLSYFEMLTLLGFRYFSEQHISPL